jgi:hypothetical protein
MPFKVGLKQALTDEPVNFVITGVAEKESRLGHADDERLVVRLVVENSGFHK